MTAFWVAALFLATGGIFLLPLLPALVELKRRQDIAPLKIEQGHEGNARYFAESFRGFILKAISHEASRKELLILDTGNSEILNTRAASGNSMQCVVVSAADLRVPDGLAFEQEMYGQSDIAGGHGNRYRAVLAEGDFSLGENSVVLRWAHARRMTVGAGATLFGRTTATESIEVHAPASFMRMNAPVITFGEPCGSSKPWVPDQATFSRHVIHGDYRTQDGECVSGSIVANGFAVITQGALISGSIKGGTGVRVEPGAAVNGSLISGSRAEILGPCHIVGPVIAEGEVLIGRDAVIGSPDMPTTITAAVIRIQPGACVHGSIWAKERGWVEA